MRIILFIILLAILKPAQAAKEYTEEERKAIHKATGKVINCGKKNTVILDDKVSDALTIARAVTISCKQEIDDLTETLISADFGVVSDQYMHDQLLEKKSKAISNPEHFLETVLKNRSKK